jgi:hypothetical protein
VMGKLYLQGFLAGDAVPALVRIAEGH